MWPTPNLENCSTYPELGSRSQEHRKTGIPREVHCSATVDCTVKAKRVLLHSCGDGAPASTTISASCRGRYFRSIRRCPLTLSKGWILKTSFSPLPCASDHSFGKRSR